MSPRRTVRPGPPGDSPSPARPGEPPSSLGPAPPVGGTVVGVSPERVAVALAAVAVGLLALGLVADVSLRVGDVGGTVGDLLRRVALDAETAVPAWFSSSLMALCALLLFVAGFTLRSQSGRLRLLAVVFLGLSADETAMIHEMGQGLVETVAGRSFGIPLWIVPAGLVALALAAYCLPLLTRIPRAVARTWVAAGALYVAGAAGMELLAHVVSEPGELAHILLAVVEEGMEMAGLVLFAYGVLRLLAATTAAVTVAFPR